MNSAERLLPCPFCGMLPGSINLNNENGMVVHVTNNKCRLSEMAFSTKVWQTRATPPEPEVKNEK